MKTKFGILDILIIAIVCILLVIGVKVLSGQSPVVEEKHEIAFTLEIKTADKNLVELIKENDVIYNSKNKSTYGKIKNVKVVPATEITADINSGEYQMNTYDDKFDIYIDIVGNADSITDKHITIAEEKLKIGSLTHVSSKDYVASGYIVEIERGE